MQAQTPGLSYQAVIHDDNNEVVADQSVHVKFTISRSSDDSELYAETISTNTDAHGMVAVTVGTASSSADNFKALSWDGTPKKLKIELSTDGGSTFYELGEQEILYLPQAVDSSGEQTSTFQNITIGGTITDGADGVGISSTTDNNDGTFTLNFSDGTSFTTSDFTGPQGLTGAAGADGVDGAQGPAGADGADGSDGVGISSTVDNNDGTFTLNFSDNTSFTTSDFTGTQGATGATGNGIASTAENSNGTLTFTYDDGTAFTTSNLTTAKTISDDMIFDGDDDSNSGNDNYYYVSMVVNNNWRVVRYDKANINLEKEATVSNNSGQTTQPTSLEVCTGLNYE